MEEKMEKKEKINWQKPIFISILLIIIGFASFFMITESARYYTHFYEEGAWQPLYLAALLELFVIVLAVIKIGRSRTFLAFQKFIMIGVFGAIIFAAGMQAVNPTLESLATIENKEQLGDILKEEYEQLKKDREVFNQQRQKTRTAISTIERKKIVEDLKNLFKQSDVKTDTGRVALVNIILLFSIRFLVQIANIFCASMLGVYFRFSREVKEEEEDSATAKVKKIHPNAVCRFKDLHKFYVVFSDDAESKGIGKGKTPKKAWENAFQRLSNAKL